MKTARTKRVKAPMFGLLAGMLLGALPARAGAVGRPRPASVSPAESGPLPKPITPPTEQAIAAGIGRGVAFLLKNQNKDGSWGSARHTKGLNIYAPVPGGHQAYRGAVTALCISALLEVGGEAKEAVRAVARAEKWLVKHLPKLRRATPDVLYNVWGHTYGIQALLRLRARPSGKKDKERKRRRTLSAIIQQQIGMLARYEVVDGGWGYYDFRAHTKKPSGSSMSFVSAAVLVALGEARDAGFEVPPKLIKRAVASIQRQRKKDFSYLYGEYLKWWPMFSINRAGGSLGRSQACNVALRRWGDKKVSGGVLKAWLNRLFARNGWLDMGRKRPVPHESWFAVAGYFFYFGHYYAGLCIEELKPKARPRFQGYLAKIILAVQEKDGSWWDYPLYSYHKPYGTAFALMTLQRCRAR